MKNTEQFNIRISKSLIFDLEFISQHIKINRNDWLRTKIAELILKEKREILEEYEKKYITGYLTENEFKKHTGIFPTEGMKKLRTEHEAYKRDDDRRAKEIVENTFAQLNSKQNMHFDKYLKGVIKKVEAKKKKTKNKRSRSKII